MFNGFRFNGVAFNGYFAASIFSNSDREPDFRWLTVGVQDFSVRLPMQDFTVRVLAGRDRVLVPPRVKTITVRKD